MHSRCILHAFWMHPASSKKGRGNYVSFAAALSQGFALVQMHPVHVPDISLMCPRCVLHTFQTRLACVSDACKHYLVAELYHTCGKQETMQSLV